LLQRTQTLCYSAQKHFVTGHKNTLLQGTETLCYSVQKYFVTGHRNTLLQRTDTLCYSAQKHYVTGHRNTFLQRTETHCYSSQKHFHTRRKRSEKRKHIHREDCVLIRRTVERTYVPGDWIMPAPWAKISVTVKHHPLSNPACCKIVYLET